MGKKITGVENSVRKMVLITAIIASLALLLSGCGNEKFVAGELNDLRAEFESICDSKGCSPELKREHINIAVRVANNTYKKVKENPGSSWGTAFKSARFAACNRLNDLH